MNLKVSFMQLVTNKSWSGSCWEFKSFCSTSKQGEEGETIANRVKAKSAIKVHLIHGPWMKRRDDDMLNKKARNFEASWQTHPRQAQWAGDKPTASVAIKHGRVRQVAQVETRLGTNLVEQLVWSWSLVHLVDTGEDMVTLAWGGPAHWGWRSSVTFFGDTIKFDPQLKNKILLPCGKTQPRNFGACLSPSSWQFKIQPAVFWAK